MKELDLFNTYVLYELIYEEKIKNKFGENQTFPKIWYRIKNYKEKIEILKEAIDKDKNIMDTERYNILINKT